MDTEYGYSYGYSRNPMATAAVVLGIISLMTCLIFYISIPCGAMAVLLALLSHGKNPMPGRSKTGIVCGAVGITLSAAITLSSVWMVLTNREMRAYLENYLQYYLGDASFDLDEELGDLFPPLKNVLPEIDESAPADDAGGLFPAGGADDTEDGGQDAPSRQISDGEGKFI